MNHWISAKGPPDVCTACGEKVPHADGAEPPLIITGDCKGAAPITISPVRRPHLPHVTLHPLVEMGAIVVCTKCAHGAPYFDASYLSVEIPSGRPGWCQRCGKFIGDVYNVVPRRPPVRDLVQAFVDAIAAIGGKP